MGRHFQAPVRVQHRLLAIACVAILFTGLLIATAPGAHADMDGPCDGTVTIQGVDYGPDNDTPGNAILIPKERGITADWMGGTTQANTNFSGDIAVEVGPASVQVVTWQADNADDTREASGRYNLDDAWDEIPDRDLLNGIYEARGRHRADGFRCEATVFLDFGSGGFDNPIILALLAIGVLLLGGLWFTGRPVREAFFAGRPILGVIVGLLFGVVLALLLQQLSIWPLDNITFFGLPALGILLGLVLAKLAPFGKPAA